MRPICSARAATASLRSQNSALCDPDELAFEVFLGAMMFTSRTSQFSFVVQFGRRREESSAIRASQRIWRALLNEDLPVKLSEEAHAAGGVFDFGAGLA